MTATCHNCHDRNECHNRNNCCYLIDERDVNINSPTILNLLTILTGWCFMMFMFHHGTITNTSCSRTCCITKDKIGMLVKMKSISQLKAQKNLQGIPTISDSHTQVIT